MAHIGIRKYEVYWSVANVATPSWKSILRVEDATHLPSNRKVVNFDIAKCDWPAGRKFSDDMRGRHRWFGCVRGGLDFRIRGGRDAAGAPIPQYGAGRLVRFSSAPERISGRLSPCHIQSIPMACKRS